LKRVKSDLLVSSFLARAAAVSKEKLESFAGAFVADEELPLLRSRAGGGDENLFPESEE
jgi:hypothetical protein